MDDPSGDGRSSDAEVDSRMKRLREKVDAIKAEVPPADLDVEFQTGLDKIEERAENLSQGVSMPDVPSWEFKRPKIPGTPGGDASGYLGLGVGLSVAYSLVGSAVAGWLVGYLIDRNTQGFLFQAIGTLVGSVAGLVASILTIIRAQNKQDKR